MVKVIKDFFTFADEELCVEKDEVLQVIEVVDRHWVKCQGSRGQGRVPTANVIVKDDVPCDLEDGHYVMVADVHFNAERDGDLSLRRGDIVVGKRLEQIQTILTKSKISGKMHL